MFNLNENDIQRTRREDMMRTAEHARQISELQDSDQKSAPFYAASLAHLGDMMVEIGSRLQDRYGELVEDVQQASVEAVQLNTSAPKASKLA